MRKLSLALLSAVALAMSGMAARALDLEVSNESKTAIHHIYMSAVGEKNWGEDQLGDSDEDTIDPGDTYTINDISPGNYDLKLVATDKTVCVIGNVRFGTDKTWTVTEAMLDKCNNQ